MDRHGTTLEHRRILRRAAVVQLEHGDASVGDEIFPSSILGILGNPRACNQLHGRNAPGKDQIVYDFSPFVVDMSVDQVDKRFVLLGKTDARVVRR
jgi:hypothetical protein